MKKSLNIPIPAVRALKKLGQDINYARRRRRITIKLLAERAALSRATVLKEDGVNGHTLDSEGCYKIQ